MLLAPARSLSELQRNRQHGQIEQHRAGFFFGGVDSDCPDPATWWLHEGQKAKRPLSEVA